MTLPTRPLELAIFLHDQLVASERFDGIVSGRVPMSLDFVQVVAALESTELYASSDETLRRVSFGPVRNYYVSMDGLLDHPRRRVSRPLEFYIEDLDYLSSNATHEELPLVICNYFAATSLFGAMKAAADHVVKVGGREDLVFLHATKCVITPDYTADDLHVLPDLRNFVETFVGTTTHAKQKATILRTVLGEMFKDLPRVPFSAVLRRFEAIAGRCQSSYQLYVAEFSFDKVKDQVEKEKVEFTAKLNNVFASIQNQLLAVPAALILVGGQLQEAKRFTLGNVLIWSGAFVFAVLMNLLIRNQRHTLNSIHREVLRQSQIIEGRHLAIAHEFRSDYSDLEARYKHQRVLLITIDALVAFSLSMATWMFLKYSVEWSTVLNAAVIGIVVGHMLVAAYACARAAIRWLSNRR